MIESVTERKVKGIISFQTLRGLSLEPSWRIPNKIESKTKRVVQS
jgi:hypothetical protein